MRRDERIRLFVQEIRSWYVRHKRELPWRDLDVSDDTQRAYMVLVSEIMLQQTQVPRVIITFKNFLRTFPTLESLAAASNAQILIAWRGMGYNSRALRLRDAARVIIDEFGGVFPSDFDQLLSIKGIGHYTAGAVRNFAFNIPTPCIDTNIRRILHRTFVGPENADGSWKKDDQYLLDLAGEILSVVMGYDMQMKQLSESAGLVGPATAGLHKGKGWSVEGKPLGFSSTSTADWHAALMDYGSLVQTKNNPKWDICPLTARGICKTTREMFVKTRGARVSVSSQKRLEPGRYVGSTFVPNRIFRGRVVEALRDAPKGLALETIGKEVAIDWSKEHKPWLQKLINKLVQDSLVAREGTRYALKK